MKGSYRTADGKATIEWELEDTDRGPEFSATGTYAGGAGQCLEAIAQAYPQDVQAQQMVAVWRGHHLNGMHAGTREQEACIDAAMMADKTAEHDKDRHTWSCDVLKAANLYVVMLTAEQAAEYAPKGGWKLHDPTTNMTIYVYGDSWLYWRIPDDVLARIRSWASLPQPEGSQYDHDATEFLHKFGLKLRITKTNGKPCPWAGDGPCGDHYRVTLSGKKRRLSFDFWGSQRDAETGEDPSPYSVLACVSSDINTPETFAKYCQEFGDDEDSIKAKQTFNRCNKFARRLRAFLTVEEREALEQIQ